MRRIAGIVCVVALLAAISPIRAEEDAKARAILAKAIKAHGGADKLNKLKASVIKNKGKFYGMGDGIDYTGETSVQLPDRIRTEVEGKVGDQDFKFVQIVNGDKGWRKLGDNVEDMAKEQLAEAREQMYVQGVIHLSPLMDKSYKLSSLGEMKVGDRSAIGVRVEHKGFRDISLFFDKDNSLLLKSETRGKDPMRGGEEFTATTTFGDYKKVDGIMAAHKLEIQRDGKKYVESEVTEVKFSEKLEDSVFAKP
jgi:hypothetical protein